MVSSGQTQVIGLGTSPLPAGPQQAFAKTFLTSGESLRLCLGYLRIRPLLTKSLVVFLEHCSIAPALPVGDRGRHPLGCRVFVVLFLFQCVLVQFPQKKPEEGDRCPGVELEVDMSRPVGAGTPARTCRCIVMDQLLPHPQPEPGTCRKQAPELGKGCSS